MILIQKFWQRALDPKLHIAPAMLLRDPYAGVEKVMPVSYLAAGFAVGTIMAYLRKQGLKRGDRVAILGWNSPEWVWADFAVQSLGGVTVPIYPNSSAEQVNFVLKNSGALATFSNEAAQLAKVEVGTKIHFDQIVPALQPGLAERPFLDWMLPASPHSKSFAVAPALAEVTAM
jgi:long-subunit acyl-CoA synthetase (AMP-forming)